MIFSYMYIRFSASNESNALKNLVNSVIDAISVFRHRSSSQSIKETTVTGKVADNQIFLCKNPKVQIISKMEVL